MRCACVDIGSNTTRLLVADCSGGLLREIEMTRVFTRIGSALDDDGALPAAKIDEVAQLVSADVERARELGAERQAVVATAALRDARNGDEALGAIAAACGEPVRLLADHEEARLTFEGAARTLGEPLDGALAVVDVGGRSTEVAVGESHAGSELWVRSFGIGSGLLADLHLHSDPPAPAELDAARAHARKALAGLDAPPAVRAVACGGSAGSLRRMTGEDLNGPALARAIDLFAGAPAAHVAERFELDPERVRLLPAGVLILDAVREALAMPLTVGNGGLREGVLLQLAERGSLG